MQLFDLTGKTTLITGASGCLAEQYSRCLPSANAPVISATRNGGSKSW